MHAHESGLSTATIDLAGEKIAIQLVFVPSDLIPLGETPDLLATRAIVWTGDTSSPVRPLGVHRDPEAIQFSFEVPRTAGSFQSLLISELARGHRQLLTVRGAQGLTLRTRLLTARESGETITVADLAQAKPAAARWPFLAALLGGGVIILIVFLIRQRSSAGRLRIAAHAPESFPDVRPRAGDGA